MASSQCTGSPTFDETYSRAISEWPNNLPGYICKTPPFGMFSAERFAQCCSGPVYNITSPTNPGDTAYPVTCATLCQVDPALTKSNDNYPYGWGEYFMCLTNGGTDTLSGSVTCDNVTVKGNPPPTSFPHTPTGSWMTKSYALNSLGFPIPTVAVSSDNTSTTSSSDSATISTASRSEETVLSSPTSQSPSSMSSSSPLTDSTTVMGTTAPTAPSSTPSNDAPSPKRITTALLVVSMLCAGLGSL